MSTTQNDIDKTFTEQELADFDAALTKLEAVTQDLPVLTGADKAAHVRPPDGAGDWVQGMLTRAQQNLNKLSRDFDPALVQRDLDLIGAIDPRLLRLQRVVDRLAGARFLAGSDSFAVMLGARRQLKDSGVAGVDDNLSEGLQRFFSRASHAQPAPPPK